MSKHGVVVLGALGLLLTGGCAGNQGPATETAHTETAVEAVYDCDAGQIVLIDSKSGPALMVSRLRRVILNPWRDSQGDHFLSLEHVGKDRRPVAFEYLVPRDRMRSAKLRTYDRSEGAYFKVTERQHSWRIRGEPSSSARCALSHLLEVERQPTDRYPVGAPPVFF